jgi:Family of unknown function (DUF6090)
MEKNKTSRYLKYAIGEIVLVVIGILLALQINTWNQERLNRKQEIQLLNQLLIEYSNNLNQLNSKISIRNEVTRSSIKILNYRKVEVNEINIDTFNLHVSRTLTRPTFDPELGVTNELTNSGNLYLISNDELRNRITAFNSLLSALREEEMVIFNLIEERYIPFLIDNYQIGPVVANFITDYTFISKTLIIDSIRNKLPENIFEGVSPYELINHPDLSDYLLILIANTDYTNNESEGVKGNIEKIIALINQELEHSN